MPTWTLGTEHIRRPVLVIPGFNQGRSKRGAWFAWTEQSLDFFKKFPRKGWNTVEYEIFEPDSDFPLSEAEIKHLAYEIAQEDRGYSKMVDFTETLFGGKIRRMTGVRGLGLYLMMILATNQWWIIILLRPWMFLTNFVNALRGRLANRAVKKTVHLFVERGKDIYIKKALNEANRVYQELHIDEPLKKYQYLRNLFKRKRKEEMHPEQKRAYELIEEAYRDIISYLLGDSLLIKLVPLNIFQRILQLVHITEQIPLPNNVFAVRNLSKELKIASGNNSHHIVGQRRVDGNNLEMFLLWRKDKDPVIVPAEENFFSRIYSSFIRETTFSRTDTVQARNYPLQIDLYVGTEREKEALLGINPIEPEDFNSEIMRNTRIRIQRALLDTFRQNEALLNYYMREVPRAQTKMMRNLFPQYWWYRWVHIGFPWLFIFHGIPAFAIVAATWLFWDPLWESTCSLGWQDYFNNQIQGTGKQYRNIQLKLEVHSGLGDVNARIREKKSYREVMEKIEEYYLPVQLRDMVLLNNITMETSQLKDFQREANNFTTLPLPAGCFDGKKVSPLGEILS